MPITTRTEALAMPDGGQMAAHLCLPDTGSGPGLLVLMEIFGVGSYIRRACERLAELGYVAMAPDLYRRIDPGVELSHDEAGLQQAGAKVGQLDVPGAIADAGGTLAYHLAAVAQPAVAVSVTTARASSMRSARATRSSARCCFTSAPRTATSPSPMPNASPRSPPGTRAGECAIQSDGGHAFDNHDSEMFSRPEAAARAWELTSRFLARTLT